MKLYTLIFLLFSLTFSAGAEYTLPLDRQAVWTPNTADGTPGTGIPGGLEQYIAGGVNDRAVTGTVINMTSAPYNCATDASTDCSAAIELALANATGPTVIYFPAGDYLLTEGFIYSSNKDEITIRGAGPGVTTFVTSTVEPIFVFSSPGGASANQRNLSGTKTKGTATVGLETSPGVPDVSGYTVGAIIQFNYENEENNARIQAGAPPTWNSLGFPYVRAHTALVTDVNSGAGTITVHPPLPWDGTYLNVRARTMPNNNQTNNWGFEDFSVTFNNSAHTTQFINADTSKYCWYYNLYFENWSKDDANGSCIKMTSCYRHEVNKCHFHAPVAAGVDSDGCIETVGTASSLFVNNIVSGQWGISFYESGGSTYNAWLYNYTTPIVSNIMHNTNPSLNLIEGNIGNYYQSDGYHGSSSHNVIFRNYYKFSIVLNRMKRNYSLIGNVIGVNGTTTGGFSWGNPNMGNGTAYGFAGPTGLSTSAGVYEYSQRDYPGIFVYQIQPSDISVGDFWRDWLITGELTAKSGDSMSGTFTVSHGFWYVGDDIGGSLLIKAYWNDQDNSISNGVVTSVVGNTVQITFPVPDEGVNGPLPAVGTTFKMRLGPAAFQERDLDVEASSETRNNYIASSSGTGSLQNTIAPDTLPNSLAYASQPAWWTADSFTGSWPPVTPNSPVFSDSLIPAGFRYTASPPPVDTSPPTIIAATVPAGGNTIIISYSENVVVGAGGGNGISLFLSLTPSTATYASGSGTTNLVYNLSAPIVNSDSGTASYTQPGNGVKDAVGNETVSASGIVIANNSLVPGPSVTQKGWKKHKARKLLIE